MAIKKNSILVKYLGNMYKSVNFSRIEEAFLFVEESNEREKLWDSVEFVHYIDDLLSSMPNDYEFILRNDYFRCREKKWYLKYYTKSTYYRLKDEALDEFVRCVTS